MKLAVSLGHEIRDQGGTVCLPPVPQMRQMHHSATARPSLDGGVHLTRPRVPGGAVHHSATARLSADGGVHPQQMHHRATARPSWTEECT